MERNRPLKRLEFWLKNQLGYFAHIKTEIQLNKKWMGSEYGGFYIHTDNLPPQPLIYSFGLGLDISFDLEAIDATHALVYGFDPTPKSLHWLAQQNLPNNFHYYPYGIGKANETVTFLLPTNEDHVSGSIYNHPMVDAHKTIEVQLRTLSTLAKDLGHNHIDVLKMDIEGSEYEVIESILHSGISISQILLETHERFFKDGKKRGERLFKSLAEAGYKVFAISDTYQEISFIKA